MWVSKYHDMVGGCWLGLALDVKEEGGADHAVLPIRTKVFTHQGAAPERL